MSGDVVPFQSTISRTTDVIARAIFELRHAFEPPMGLR